MEICSYNKADIEKVLNIVNKFPITTGEQNYDLAFKLVTIFNVLNNPLKNDSNNENKEIKPNNID